MPSFDYFLVIDSEGLQSIEKLDSEYDRKIMLFCLAVSHVVIINIKDQFTHDLEQLLEVCVEAFGALAVNKIVRPTLYYVFN